MIKSPKIESITWQSQACCEYQLNVWTDMDETNLPCKIGLLIIQRNNDKIKFIAQSKVDMTTKLWKLKINLIKKDIDDDLISLWQLDFTGEALQQQKQYKLKAYFSLRKPLNAVEDFSIKLQEEKIPIDLKLQIMEILLAPYFDIDIQNLDKDEVQLL